MTSGMRGSRLGISRRRALRGGAIGLGGGLAAFLAACGGGGKSGDSSSSSSSSTGSLGGATPASAGNNKETPQRGGEIVVRRNSSFTFGNPLRSSSGYDTAFNQLYAAPLLELTTKGELIPHLAEKWEQSDQTTAAIKLRPGMTFQDGTPVNSQAVKFSINLAKTPELASVVRTAMLPIAAIDTPDELTAVLKFDKPNATFMQTLAASSPAGGGSLVSPTTYQKLGEDKFNETPVSVGPYNVQSLDRSAQMVLARNPNWKVPGPNGEQWPYLDKITVKVVPESAVSLADMQAGNIDIDQLPGAENVETIKANPQLTYLAQKGATLQAVSFVTNKAPTNNLALRKAICYAIDRDEFAKVFTHGLGDPAKQAITGLSWAYDDKVPYYSFDQNKAREQLAQAGLADGVDMKLVTYTSGDYPRMGELLQSQLGKIKIKVQVDNLEVPVYTEQFRVKANYPFAVEGLGAPAGDPYGFFQSRYTSNGNYNAGKPNNPEFDALVAQAATTFDQNERKKIYSKMQQMDYELAYRAWLLYAPTIVAFNKRVKGMDWLGAYSTPDLRYIWKSK